VRLAYAWRVQCPKSNVQGQTKGEGRQGAISHHVRWRTLDFGHWTLDSISCQPAPVYNSRRFPDREFSRRKPEMLAPETVLQGRYRIVRLLGQGGMGAVYEAIDQRLDSTVALKETLFADERLRKQFEREAKLLAGMHHPALPRVSDHFAEGDGQFLVMQFIPGQDLAQMMQQKQGPFPPDQVLTWGDQLLDALDYLHTQDPPIIHRDIKPQNLKLTGRGQIILLDFGLAKGQAVGVSVATTSASIFGYTPNYAPLEQIQGLGTDARSDIYALSATLYHLLTAVKPPDALSRAAALVNGQPDPLAPANEISTSIGPEVATVLARAMSQNRDQRYTTAAAMRGAMKGTEEAVTLIGRGEAATVLHAPSAAPLANTQAADAVPTVLKSGETTVVRSVAPGAKKRVAPWAIAAAAVVLIGVLFGGFYAYQHRKASEAATPSSSPEPTNSVKFEPSPTAEHGTEPVSGSLGEKKLATANPSPAANQVAKKTEKPTKKTDRSKPSDGSDDGETPGADERSRTTMKEFPVVPNSPEIFAPNNSEDSQRRNRQLGIPTTQKLPNGTQVMVLADGTRIVTMPNGNKRVIPPGQRVFRRKGKNN
jgi:serine/threonine protein kinase